MQRTIAFVAIGALVLMAAYFILIGRAGAFEWHIASLSPDMSRGSVPRTALTLTYNGVVYSAGTFDGSCSVIDGTSWKLLEGEKSGVICWWAGGGKEVGVFKEGGQLVAKLGDLDEGSAETPGMRGNFQELFKLSAPPKSPTPHMTQ